MLFDVFSWGFRSDVVLPQAKKREVVMSSRGGLNVAISLVLDMFRKRHVFRRCVLNEFRSRFQWKIVCSGGAQELKTVEILLPKWYFLFSLFIIADVALIINRSRCRLPCRHPRQSSWNGATLELIGFSIKVFSLQIFPLPLGSDGGEDHLLSSSCLMGGRPF